MSGSDPVGLLGHHAILLSRTLFYWPLVRYLKMPKPPYLSANCQNGPSVVTILLTGAVRAKSYWAKKKLSRISIGGADWLVQTNKTHAVTPSIARNGKRRIVNHWCRRCFFSFQWGSVSLGWQHLSRILSVATGWNNLADIWVKCCHPILRIRLMEPQLNCLLLFKLMYISSNIEKNSVQ